jgi:hypothetical protein
VENKILDIFILEDSSERMRWFKQTFSDCNIVYTKDVKNACDELRTKDYDLIFLDRDLGWSTTESGEDVARVMKEEQLAKDACVVIHSVNPVGVEIMKNYLEEYHNSVKVIRYPSLLQMKRGDFKCQ